MNIVEIDQIDETKIWENPKINWESAALWTPSSGVSLAFVSLNEPKYMGLVSADFDDFDELGHPVITVQTIEVHPSYQRRGIATALLKALAERTPGARYLDLAAPMPDGWALADAFSAETTSRDDYDVVARINTARLAEHDGRVRLVVL